MISNCFNYMGSKDRILPLIDENLDKSKEFFIDLFCGSSSIMSLVNMFVIYCSLSITLPDTHFIPLIIKNFSLSKYT